MLIKRTLADNVNVSVILTHQELVEAAMEYEHEQDVHAVQEEIESHILMAPDNAPDNTAINFFGKVTTIKALRELQENTDKMSEVASKMRDFMDDDAGCILTDFENDCRKAAFDELIDKLLP